MDSLQESSNDQNFLFLGNFAPHGVLRLGVQVHLWGVGMPPSGCSTALTRVLPHTFAVFMKPFPVL